LICGIAGQYLNPRRHCRTAPAVDGPNPSTSADKLAHQGAASAAAGAYDDMDLSSAFHNSPIQ